MAQKRPRYTVMRLLKRLSVYVFCISCGVFFWWLAGNSALPLSSYIGVNSPAGIEKKPDPKKTLLPAELERQQFGTKTLERLADRVLKGESLSIALSRHGFSSQDVLLIANLLRKEINLKTIRPGDVFIIERNAIASLDASMTNTSPRTSFDAFELIRTDSANLPVRFRIQPKNSDSASSPETAKSENDFELQRFETTVSVKQEALYGSIENSLYDGIIYSGGDAALVNRFSELFGWQIDFYRETQRGDRFKMLVESKYVDGRFVGYGRVRAGEYATGNRTYRAFYYESPDGQNTGIYDEKGQSLEKTFLKSPLELARITSRYGQRFHPILRQQKKHNGIDYGASTGTPFWAVADGVVLEARYSPTAGNMIRIKHRNGYVTEYFHASKIAPGVRAGATVRQRQVIGYVGTTGRSTGPHLHFGMLSDKHYVDPSKQNFPTGQSLPKKEVARYESLIQPLLAELSKISIRDT